MAANLPGCRQAISRRRTKEINYNIMYIVPPILAQRYARYMLRRYEPRAEVTRERYTKHNMVSSQEVAYLEFIFIIV